MLSILLTFAAAGAAPASGEAAKPVNQQDVVKCKREIETGSLVKSRRVCHTAREWAALAAAARADVEEMRKPGHTNGR